MKPADLDVRSATEQAKQAVFAVRLVCCASTGCNSSGSMSIQDAMKKQLKAAGVDTLVQIVPTGCMGLCSKGPLIYMNSKTHPDILFTEITAELAEKLLAEVVIPSAKGVKNELPPLLAKHTLSLDLPFFTKQVKVVLENNGRVNPESIDDFIAHDGYKGLRRALEMTPEEVCVEMKASGLRGRGGAGFMTGVKWDMTRKVVGDNKYIICNGDEGDPGAFMDRSVLEGDPHAVIEGMLIAAHAVGANRGMFYIRAEYPLAVERVEKALRHARAAGIIGKNVLETGWAFDAEIRLGAGAFVCGEETALIASCEGKRGTPRPRPPFPAVKGLWDLPTCINNVETLANVTRIMRKGAAWYAAMGTEKSKGTKVFAVTGKIANNGLIEVPMGITLREIVEDMCGGTGTDRTVKAIQTGGPSGGLIPASKFDTPVSYESLIELGSMMGSGGMIVIDDSDSVVDLARFYLEFCVDESCGKCAPCRIGGKQLLTILERIADGHGSEKDIDLAKRVAQAMKKASLCGLGQTAPNPVLSSLRYFPEEFAERMQKPGGEPVGGGCHGNGTCGKH